MAKPANANFYNILLRALQTLLRCHNYSILEEQYQPPYFHDGQECTCKCEEAQQDESAPPCIRTCRASQKRASQRQAPRACISAQTRTAGSDGFGARYDNLKLQGFGRNSNYHAQLQTRINRQRMTPRRLLRMVCNTPDTSSNLCLQIPSNRHGDRRRHRGSEEGPPDWDFEEGRPRPEAAEGEGDVDDCVSQVRKGQESEHLDQEKE